MKDCGIIFDCDGTLVDSLGQALESFNYALSQVGEEPRTPETIKRYFGAGADRIFMSLLGDEKKALAAFDSYVDHQSELAKGMKLHPGIRELLDLLAKEQIPMGVVTGRHARDLNVVLSPHQLNDYFLALVADSHLPHSKPAPDGILMAAKQMELPPSRTFYVGDSATDIRAAHNAGSIGIAALWDALAKPAELLNEKPALMAKEPMEIWTYFKKSFQL